MYTVPNPSLFHAHNSEILELIAHNHIRDEPLVLAEEVEELLAGEAEDVGVPDGGHALVQGAGLLRVPERCREAVGAVGPSPLAWSGTVPTEAVEGRGSALGRSVSSYLVMTSSMK